MKLFDLLSRNAPDIEIATITDNSAVADVHSVFFCICGARADGHTYAADAYRNGCRAFVCEKELTLPADACTLRVADTRLALAQAAARLYRNPSNEIKLIGVTGTKGKTTVATLLSRVLCAAGIPCGYIGTNGIAYQNQSRSLKNTTPDPITLQQTLRQMADNGIKAVVMEVSSQAVYQSRISETAFDTCIFTNLYTDHIGPAEHPTFEHYKTSKHRLFTDFGCKTMICNLDDPYASEMQADTSADRIISYATKQENADFYAYNALPTLGKNGYGVSFYLRNTPQDIPCTLPMPGTFNVQNALAVIAAAKATCGISEAEVIRHLESLTVEGRTETIPLACGACAVIDYAHNGTSLSALLSALREYKPHRLICLFGSVGERSFLRRNALGKAAAQLSDLSILTSDNPGREDPMAIISEIAKAFEGTATPYLVIPDRAEAIRSAVKMLTAGDILVLAGKGHENYQLIGREKLPFSEKDLLKQFM